MGKILSTYLHGAKKDKPVVQVLRVIGHVNGFRDKQMYLVMRGRKPYDLAQVKRDDHTGHTFYIADHKIEDALKSKDFELVLTAQGVVREFA